MFVVTHFYSCKYVLLAFAVELLKHPGIDVQYRVAYGWLLPVLFNICERQGLSQLGLN